MYYSAILKLKKKKKKKKKRKRKSANLNYSILQETICKKYQSQRQFFIPRHTIVVGQYVFLFVRPSFYPSVSPWFHFSNLNVIDRFYSNFVCTCISGVKSLGLLMVKFRFFFFFFFFFFFDRVICPPYVRIFVYLTDNNLSKYQCIFIKHGMCIDIVEI